MRRAVLAISAIVALLLGPMAAPAQHCSGTRHTHCTNEYPNELHGYAWYYRAPETETSARP